MEGHPPALLLDISASGATFIPPAPIKGSCYVAEAGLKLAAILLPQLQDFSFRDTP